MPCDLVTGEERIFVDPEGRQSDHIACTIEMCSVTTPCEYRNHLNFWSLCFTFDFQHKLQSNASSLFRWSGCHRWNSDDQRSFQRVGMDESSAWWVDSEKSSKLELRTFLHIHVACLPLYFLLLKEHFMLCLNRIMCWRDSCVWRVRSNWLHHWTHVHHRWRGGGESDMQFFTTIIV